MEELRYLEIYTRKAVRDHHVGDYRSPLRGRGFEFDQHKRYQHGDDYRQIDWNATARSRRFGISRRKRTISTSSSSCRAGIDASPRT